MRIIFTYFFLLINLSLLGQLHTNLNTPSVGNLEGNLLWYNDDITFKINTRSGLTLTDRIGSNDVTILVPSFLSHDGTSKILGDASRSEERMFDGGSYTFYFQFKRMGFFPAAGSHLLVNFGGGATGQRGVQLRTYNSNLWLMANDGATAHSSTLGVNINNTFDSTKVYDVIVTITTSTITCDIYDQSGNAMITSHSEDISDFVFNTNNNNTSWQFSSKYGVVDNVKKFSSIKTIAECQTDSDTTSLVVHVPNVWAGADISGNQVDFSYSVVDTNDLVYTATHDWLLDYGFDAFENGWNAYHMRQIGRSTDGTTHTPSRSAGAQWVASRLVYQRGASDYVTLRDCKLRFTNSFFDRSNTTIWSDSARSTHGHYDSENPYDFHITELSQKWLYDVLNAGYKGRLFVDWDDNSVEKWDRKRLKQVYLYGTDKTGDEHYNILKQTNDVIATIRDSQGDTVCDGTGYLKMGRLKADTGMIVFRLDDGFNDIYDTWKPFLDSFAQEPFVGIHPAEAGNSQYHGFDTLRLLQTDGYAMVANNDSDIDYSTLYYVDRVELDMSNTLSSMRGEGLTANHYMGNRHSSSNPTIDYITHKLGLKTHHTASNYTADSTSGICSLYPDLFRLQSMPLDINVPAGNPYDLSVDPNAAAIAAIKAQLDICLAQDRLVIMFVHTYRENVRTALREIFQYAESIGVPVYPLDTALEHIKYLE